MNIAVITLFPEMFSAVRDYGVVGRAIQAGRVNLHCINPRDFTQDNYQKIDDRPYGGGPGMVMMAEPLSKSIAAAKQRLGNKNVKTVYLSPQGKAFNQQQAQQIASSASDESLILLAGRYEGVDERLLASEVDEEWSVGDFVLSGGELAAMLVIDSVARLLPGALGHEQSVEQDSFSDGLLDCPHYTRPEVYQDMQVPEILLSGNHAQIERWRLQQALLRTHLRRPDLLAARGMNEQEQALLAEILQKQ